MDFSSRMDEYLIRYFVMKGEYALFIIVGVRCVYAFEFIYNCGIFTR